MLARTCLGLENEEILGHGMNGLSGVPGGRSYGVFGDTHVDMECSDMGTCSPWVFRYRQIQDFSGV